MTCAISFFVRFNGLHIATKLENSGKRNGQKHTRAKRILKKALYEVMTTQNGLPNTVVDLKMGVMKQSHGRSERI